MSPKTTLLPLIRLQNEAIQILQYHKTQTIILYSKHKILNMPDFFKLSVGKVMYSFDNGKIPNHFDNYSDIVSVHNYQTGLLYKNIIYPD